jgi:hypothetical protein
VKTKICFFFQEKPNIKTLIFYTGVMVWEIQASLYNSLFFYFYFYFFSDL